MCTKIGCGALWRVSRHDFWVPHTFHSKGLTLTSQRTKGASPWCCFVSIQKATDQCVSYLPQSFGNGTHGTALEGCCVERSQHVCPHTGRFLMPGQWQYQPVQRGQLSPSSAVGIQRTLAAPERLHHVAASSVRSCTRKRTFRGPSKYGHGFRLMLPLLACTHHRNGRYLQQHVDNLDRCIFAR